MQTLDAISRELDQINEIRTGDKTEVLHDFKQGELAGAQQALAWVEGTGMAPIAAILTKHDRAAMGIQD